MPQDIPEDFGFAIQYGAGKKHEINTFTSTFTKDLITAGTVTTDMTFTEEEMEFIYAKMKEINIADTKQLIPEPIGCTMEPYGEDEWVILINKETIRQTVSETYCEPTQEAQQLIDLRETIFDLIKKKDSYKELPEAVGGYE
ncbi:hypothetical protein [Sporosarcina luteola]|uniref:hypothetical protein n=1 Tax=Sporosarcina luteola TaxID=582850 RepID=UPI0020422696|nr:hypothetical protein [Sporosarcina luteola]MCM3709551.1 hypothetical protein [Sporosarcina luteola]